MLNRKGSAEILSSIAQAVISIIQENEDADDGKHCLHEFIIASFVNCES